MRRVIDWAKNNIVAIILVLCFSIIYIISQVTGTAFEHWGSTSMEYLHAQYFRWLTCIFLHFNFEHIFFNSAGNWFVDKSIHWKGKNAIVVYCLWNSGRNCLFCGDKLFTTCLCRGLIRWHICTYSNFYGLLSEISNEICA